MNTFGLLGFPLGHSFSQSYFNSKFKKLNLNDHRFLLFEHKSVSEFIANLGDFNDLKGFSVTSPHKENIIPFLDALDKITTLIGAVNCVKVVIENDKKKLIGYNTDYFGFQKSLRPFLEPVHQKALILGTGGAAKAVSFALKNIGIEVWFVSRTRNENNHQKKIFGYPDLNEQIFSSFKLIVNTTPAEMLFGSEAYPQIPYNFLTEQHLCYDLIYQPEETEFLKRSKAFGAQTLNGLDMLYAQAEKSWEIWNV
ncbi:MAG: shikimate dehydrogenase family protein [Bacteroidota bacterium]